MSDDTEFAEAMRRLSPEDTTGDGFSRRLLLKAALAGVGGLAATAAISPFGRVAAAAGLPMTTPAVTPPGLLLLIQLGGGNDGFNTLVPIAGEAGATYRKLRGAVAVAEPLALNAPGTTTPTGMGLNPSLPYMASQFSLGRVAIVQGIGYPNSSLSHFDAIATWMFGGTSGVPTSGWIGRWLDGMANPSPFQAVQIGSGVPLHLIGATRRAVSAGDWVPEFGVSADTSDQLMYGRMQALNASASSRGALATKVGASINTAMVLNQQVAPLYSQATPLPDGGLGRRLSLAARLFNANIGVQVASALHSDYDQHDNQLGTHSTNLAELDAALATFFGALDPALAGRVTVMTFSEFGRKPWANGSLGTDHGQASCLMMIGSRVAGGLYGAHPNLDGVQPWQDVAATTDFRSVYATVLNGWIGGNAATVLQGSYPTLPLFVGPPV